MTPEKQIIFAKLWKIEKLLTALKDRNRLIISDFESTIFSERIETDLGLVIASLEWDDFYLESIFTRYTK